MASRSEACQLLKSASEADSHAVFVSNGDYIKGHLDERDHDPSTHVDFIGTYLAWVAEATDVSADRVAELAVENAQQTADDDLLIGQYLD